MNKPRPIENDILLGEICILLSEGKRVKLRAKGNSMMPFIRGDEDTLILAPISALSKGDVVLARIKGKRYVIHRIIGLNDEKIILMGDGNLYETEECSRSDIYGKVEYIIRNHKEYDLSSSSSRFTAIVWRTLVPMRRIRAKISNLIKRR